MVKYILLNKPFNMLSQFTPEGNRSGLSSIEGIPKEVYTIGRLDADSEGLLLLTNDNRLKTKVQDPESKIWKTYWVQVEGAITDEALEALRQPMDIRVKKSTYTTLESQANRLIEENLELWERTPPIRERKSISTSWVEIKICEGKNRQIRRMTAKVGFPTLRLVRRAIGAIQVGTLNPGEFIEIDGTEAYQKVLPNQK